MKIIVCLNNDIISSMAFNMLYPVLSKHSIELFISKSVGKSSQRIHEISLLERSIPFDVLFPLIEKRQVKGSYYSFKQFEQLEKIKVIYPKNINDPEMVEYVQNYKPDLIISIRFGQIFKTKIIEIPQKGILNLHSGVLPDYRGVLCTLQALINGEEEVGTTLHYIEDNSIDTGSIIGISKIKVEQDKSLFWHILNIYDGGIKMLCDAIEKVDNNHSISSYEQNLTEGSYYSTPSKKNIMKLIEKGFSIVDEETYKNILNLYI